MRTAEEPAAEEPTAPTVGAQRSIAAGIGRPAAIGPAVATELPGRAAATSDIGPSPRRAPAGPDPVAAPAPAGPGLAGPVDVPTSSTPATAASSVVQRMEAPAATPAAAAASAALPTARHDPIGTSDLDQPITTVSLLAERPLVTTIDGVQSTAEGTPLLADRADAAPAPARAVSAPDPTAGELRASLQRGPAGPDPIVAPATAGPATASPIDVPTSSTPAATASPVVQRMEATAAAPAAAARAAPTPTARHDPIGTSDQDQPITTVSLLAERPLVTTIDGVQSTAEGPPSLADRADAASAPPARAVNAPGPAVTPRAKASTSGPSVQRSVTATSVTTPVGRTSLPAGRTVVARPASAPATAAAWSGPAAQDFGGFVPDEDGTLWTIDEPVQPRARATAPIAVQRDGDPAADAASTAGAAAAGTVTTTAVATAGPAAPAAAAAGAPKSEAELQELCRALYPPLHRRLCRDLLVDRERAGYRTDIRF